MTGDSPNVSVIIPAYNIAGYLQEALESLQQQSLKNFEALIVDDGSTDQTAAIAQAFCDQDPRFKLLQKPNGGLSSARNHGLRHAKAPYIALLDGDDTYDPDKLASHVAVLDANPTVGVVYSATQIIQDSGQPTPLRMSGKPIHADPLLAMLCKNFVGHGSNAVFRRCIVDVVGEFDETLRSSEDMDYWIRIATLRSWTFHRIDLALSRYRVRPSGLSFNVAQMEHFSTLVLNAALQRSPDIVEPMLPTAYAFMYRYLARLALQGGNLEQAHNYIEEAWQRDRSIFFRDPRSFVTLASVKLSALVNPLIKSALGSAPATK
jgi:glycosyltransferase involved in cell wall biosynthesis